MRAPLPTHTSAREFFRRIKAKVGELIGAGPSTPKNKLARQTKTTETDQAFLESMSRMEFIGGHAEKLKRLARKIEKEFPEYNKTLIDHAHTTFVAVAGIIQSYTTKNECPDASARIDELLSTPNHFVEALKTTGIVINPSLVQTHEKTSALVGTIEKSWEKLCKDIPANRNELETALKASLSTLDRVRKDQKAFVYGLASKYFSPGESVAIGHTDVSTIDEFNTKAGAEIRGSLQSVRKNVPIKGVLREAEKMLAELALYFPRLPKAKAGARLAEHPRHGMTLS